MDRKTIILKEQQRLNDSDKAYVDSLNLSYSSGEKKSIPPYLGLSHDGWSSYFVGCSWLKEGEIPFIVHPKIENIDYWSIFTEAYVMGIDPDYFQSSYAIRFDTPPIEDSTLNSVITPLLIVHFLSVMRRLLAKGLKRNYVSREENLNNKVKGHIVLLKNFQRNVLHCHYERTICRFCEYDYDCPENRLLKRAILAAEVLSQSFDIHDNTMLSIVRHQLQAFTEVNADVSPYSVKSMRSDKLHSDYPEAIRLAKRVLLRADYALAERSENYSSVPEFVVDMSKIFEFYVLGLLRQMYKGSDILFQKSVGIMGRCDYLIPNQCLIVDAKYKLNYPIKDTETLRADIREVTGYSRSDVVRKLLNVNDEREIRCLIIYPDKNGLSQFHADKLTNVLAYIKPIEGVHNVFTLGISVPTL